ncbi:MAG TPA: VWD domain-containing protein, partial [Acidimicrobiales bacterium]|nr:VWD domain-containing protein [Acidimicrobiales bacterium]
MNLREARPRRPGLRLKLFVALATIAPLVGSGLAAPDGSLSASPLGLRVPVKLAAVRQGAEAHATVHRARTANATLVSPVGSSFTSVFVPKPTLPALVKAPSGNEAGAFAALNALLRTETRFGEALIALRVAFDRAQAATAAGAQLWVVRQANASAEYALSASRLLGGFPALQAAMVKAFVADKLSLTLTPAESAAAKAKLLRHLPASFTQLLAVAAAPYGPATVPEVAALKAAILSTGAFEGTLAHMAPKTLVLPAALVPSSLTAAEANLEVALKGYANTILSPVPASALPVPPGRFVAAEECGSPQQELAEAFHRTAEGLEGLTSAFESFGGEAGEGAAAGLGPLGAAFGYAFAFVAADLAAKQFNSGPGEGGGGGGGGGGEGGGGGGGGCGPGGGSSYGDPHELTFSGAAYGFQAAGEFTLMKSTSDNLDVQVRQQPFAGAASIAVDTATAMRVGSTIVELAGNASGDLQLWVNRHAVAYASRALAGGGKISVLGPGEATVSWPDGTTVSVTTTLTIAVPHQRVTCNSREAINLTIEVARSRFGHLEGLLGDPGTPPGTIAGGNGATYSMDELDEPWRSVQDFDVLYQDFAQSWRVSQQSSLFYYPQGTTTASYTELSFPSRALTVASLNPTSVAAAKRDCEAAGITNRYLLADCLYDVGATGSACFAAAEAHVQATTGGPTATGLPESSGTVPPSTTTTTTSPPPSTTTTGTPATSGSRLSGVSLSLSTYLAGATGVTYTIKFTTSSRGALNERTGSVDVKGPDGTFPGCAAGTLTDLTSHKSAFLLYCGAQVGDLHNELKFPPGTPISGGDRVELVLISLDNPTSPGAGTISVGTSSDSAVQVAFRTAPGAGIHSLSVLSLSTHLGGATEVTYTFRFTTSSGGALDATYGRIDVTGPDGTFPGCATGTLTDLTSHKSSPVFDCGAQVGDLHNQVDFPPAVPISGGDEVEVVLTHVDNPTSPGAHLLTVGTSSNFPLRAVFQT